MEALYLTDLLQHRPLGTYGATSSKTLHFRNVPLDTGVINLYGCTSVIVISEEGLWISHFFENPSFVNGQSQFHHDVIWMGLGSGDGPAWHEEGLWNLAYPGGILGYTSNPKAFIITPRIRTQPPEAALPGLLLYANEVGQIATRLQTLIPSAAPPVVIDYIPRGPDELYQLIGVFANTHGKVLLEYNPSHDLFDYANVKLTVEDNLVFSDRWIARPDQIVH
ncbi:hypothetical protein P153DRAFT_178958 [Dothidotthia symphoricarpi CBS 119687]|uniref:Uncharacterized protein n=1 Tax=Dothidotthia symphoricarpi CBS 119687 TaxID=1392245 RepID=A0A6A6AQ38_9PLEO|nr:uncharacterized protein P153DRAFT_178958 [Dothidotthia symphoricarpi CBS 119687]KAF2133064.1 hypothetical protein P153DRAFT_178958 [Dothidotthia symphoricarpi CBS 119687]